MKELRLKTVGRFIASVMYFYEGEAPVSDGVVTLPVTPAHLPWAQRAFLKGFREDPDTGKILEMSDIIAIYENQSAESEGDDTNVAESTESFDGRGQSPDSDGIRSSEPESGGSVPEEGMGSSQRNRPTKRAARKRPARKAVRSQD